MPKKHATSSGKEIVLLGEVRARLEALRELHPELSSPRRGAFLRSIDQVLTLMQDLRGHVDPIADPGVAFDPADPDTIGRIVTLALLTQERTPLAAVANTYGSGVYAIYYVGDNPLYAPLSRSETPIYVGKADPLPGARTTREQGPALSRRLNEHRRVILKVGAHAVERDLPYPLRLEDFDCRRLVCVTHAQLIAERHLIRIFRPVWNSEVGIAFGISKHGDSADTRKNGRSPFDVLHPGREWAVRLEKDQIPRAQIELLLKNHFDKHPAYVTHAALVELVLQELTQRTPLSNQVREELEVVASVQEALAGFEVPRRDP